MQYEASSKVIIADKDNIPSAIQNHILTVHNTAQNKMRIKSIETSHQTVKTPDVPPGFEKVNFMGRDQKENFMGKDQYKSGNSTTYNSSVNVHMMTNLHVGMGCRPKTYFAEPQPSTNNARSSTCSSILAEKNGNGSKNALVQSKSTAREGCVDHLKLCLLKYYPLLSR